MRQQQILKLLVLAFVIVMSARHSFVIVHPISNDVLFAMAVVAGVLFVSGIDSRAMLSRLASVRHAHSVEISRGTSRDLLSHAVI
jgi:hypothetical protein